jgi:hypothetical protein
VAWKQTFPAISEKVWGSPEVAARRGWIYKASCNSCLETATAMTLVANFSAYGTPILVGDIMVRSPTSTMKAAPFNIPTSENVNALLPLMSNWLVSSLVQKVSLLTPRLAIAWAGSRHDANSIFHDILERSRSPTLDDVLSVLEGRQHESGRGVYLTGLSLGEGVSGQRPIVRFAWDSNRGSSTDRLFFPDYGECYAGGTGATAFWNLLRSTRVEQPDDTPPLEAAICASLSHLGRLSGDQMRNGSGLDRFYGGGFELVTFLDGELRKIGDTAYHFVGATKSIGGQVTVTFHASIWVSYFEDYLLIRKLRFGGDVANAIGRDELYVITPVYRVVDDSEERRLLSTVRTPSLNTRFSVYYVHMPDKRSPHDIRMITHKSGEPRTPPPLAFEVIGDHMHISISPTLQAKLDRALSA